MAIARHNLGACVSLNAEALGKPGQRTFRLLAEAERGSATVWVEKQQLSALALSIQGALAELKDAPAVAAREPRGAAREPAFEIKAVSLGLAYDERTGRIGILAATQEDTERNTATVACWATRQQASRLAEQALEAAAAGRPICSLCHGSIDPEGHMCVKANGHGKAAALGQ